MEAPTEEYFHALREINMALIKGLETALTVLENPEKFTGEDERIDRGQPKGIWCRGNKALKVDTYNITRFKQTRHIVGISQIFDAPKSGRSPKDVWDFLITEISCHSSQTREWKNNLCRSC